MGTRVLILGSGYAGCAAAAALDGAARTGRVEVTVVSPHGVLVRTPLLASLVAGRIGVERTCVPLRSLAPHARHVPGHVVATDLDSRTVAVQSSVAGGAVELGFDHLVVTLGGTWEDRRVTGAAAHAWPVRTPADAIALRNRVLDGLAAAHVAGTPHDRDRLATVVVVGGGHAGASVAAAVSSLQRAVTGSWAPELAAHTRTVLSDHKQRLLPHLDASTGGAVTSALSRLGVEVVTADPVTGVTAGAVSRRSAVNVACATTVWTAGLRAVPVVEGLLPGAEVSTGGRLVVSPTLQVRGGADVWAAGDAAAVPHLLEGGEVPATVAFAVAAGRRIGRNVLRVVDREFPAAFRFRPRVEVVPVARKAVGRLRGLEARGGTPVTLADAELVVGSGLGIRTRARMLAAAPLRPPPLPLDRSEIVSSVPPPSVPVTVGRKPTAVG